MLLNEQDVDKMLEEMCEGDILLMQLEIERLSGKE